MRFRFEPTDAQVAELEAQLARLREPAVALEILRPTLAEGRGFDPTAVVCVLQRAHSDRFVLRVHLQSAGGEARDYALKVYADDFGRHVWAYAQTLAQHIGSNHNGVCLPIRYVACERALIFPWVEGEAVTKIVDERKLELLSQAARLAADLHRLSIVPEPVTTARTLADQARFQCNCLPERWPEAVPVVEPVLAAIEDALPTLDPAAPAPVHGDLAAGQFVWTGDRLVLLDLDMFAYTDPAYDAGHFLGQLERRYVSDPALPGHAERWLACFRDAYLTAMPHVSPRNIAFYQGLTLARKMYTVYRRQLPDWPRLVPRLAARAQAALEAVVSPGRVS
ncbi:MAG TPA: phosphotransferase [Gemmatimonadales bacterium]|nr:phosphotransferase [Gemmatimonadales bacterium]